MSRMDLQALQNYCLLHIGDSDQHGNSCALLPDKLPLSNASAAFLQHLLQALLNYTRGHKVHYLTQ